MTVRLVWLVAIAAVVALAQPGSAAADDKRRIIGILDVRLEGVPKEIAAQFSSNLEKQLDGRAYSIAPKSRMLQLLDNSSHWTAGCVVGPCLAEVRSQTGAELVLLAAITGDGTTFGYVITLVRTDSGRYLSQESNRCEVCTLDEVLTSATQAAVKMLDGVPAVLPDEAAQARATLDHISAAHAHALASSRRRHRRLAIATALTGLAIAGAGSALYFALDRPAYALATASAGGGLMLGGAVALAF